jgi:DNA-binding CsgD family transcriptional regulator
MSQLLSLTRTSERMIRFMESYHKVKYNGALEDFLPVLRTMQQIFPNWVLMTCPVHHPHAGFVTDNCSSVLGFTAEFFKKSLTPDFLLKRIHDDDVEDLNRCFLFLDDFLKNRMPEEYFKFRPVFYYRYRQNDGSYSLLHDEKATLVLAEDDVLYYSIVKDITADAVFSGVYIDIFRHDVATEKIASFKPAVKNSNLSKRETELIGLIKKGFSNKEMAYHLNISQHTVRNMKQKMFEKYSVNNVIELLNKTIHYN